MEEKNKQDEIEVLDVSESASDPQPVDDDMAVDDNDEDELENSKSKSVVNPVVEEDIFDNKSEKDEGDSVNNNLISRNDTANGDDVGAGSDIEIIEDNEDEPSRDQTSATSTNKTVKVKNSSGDFGDVIQLDWESDVQLQSENDTIQTGDDEEVMEIPDTDPFSDCSQNQGKSESDSVVGKIPKEKIDSSGEKAVDSEQVPIVVNDTKSLVEIASSKKEPGEEPTSLVIIDTNSILSGKGPVPLEKSSSTSSSKSQDSSSSNVISRATQPTNQRDGILLKYTNALEIPDDAFLTEAPSFIVPYVFEQSGEKSLKDAIKDLEVTIRKTRDLKLEKGEELDDMDDIIIETKKSKSDDYFDGPVGKLLMSVGMKLVQECIQVDLLKMQKRKAEEERAKSQTRTISMQTQQSILSLKKNIEESKENNEPFRHETKKCTFCHFKTESNLVLSAHLETPHMRNYSYRCNFCDYTTRAPHEILFHMEAEHFVKPRLERAPAYHQCPNCSFEDNSKATLTRHLIGCSKRFKIEKNLEPPLDWDTPAKLPKLRKSRLLPQAKMNSAFMGGTQQRNNAAPKFIPRGNMSMPPLVQAPKSKPVPGLIRTSPKIQQQQRLPIAVGGPLSVTGATAGNVGRFLSKLGSLPNSLGGPAASAVQKGASALRSLRNASAKPSTRPSMSITPLPRQAGSNSATTSNQSKGAQGGAGQTSFVICEICDGYIKDLDQLRNHMEWIHKVKIQSERMNHKPPMNCQKCQFRFFTDQGLERHLLGSHGLVTFSMQDAASKGHDSGRCPLCGKVYQWKLLAHVAKDHNVTLMPAQLSYKCTVCTATFGMYKLFENHVYSVHSMTGKKNERRPVPGINNKSSTYRAAQMQITSRPMSAVSNQNSFKPMKINENDEITIISQRLANSNPSLMNKGSLTITRTPPGSTSRRSLLSNDDDDDGIQVIEIYDAPSKPSANGRNPKGNGDFKGRLPIISDSTLRKRNLELSVCGTGTGTDSDNNSSHESFNRGSAHKRLRSSRYITIN